MSQDYEKARDEAWNNILFYHGCLTGDCPHEISGQCYEALVKAGFDAATEYWKSQADVEFDEDSVIKELERQRFSRTVSFLAGRYIARWQFDKLLPVIGAVRLKANEKFRVLEKSAYDALAKRLEKAEALLRECESALTFFDNDHLSPTMVKISDYFKETK